MVLLQERRRSLDTFLLRGRQRSWVRQAPGTEVRGTPQVPGGRESTYQSNHRWRKDDPLDAGRRFGRFKDVV